MSETDYRSWWEALAEPFDAEDYEWRLAQCGKTKSGKFWAICLCYVTNRPIMNRLDGVCGPENWKNEFSKGPEGGVVCGISIRVNEEWITKYDAAENTEIEPVKGGISDSMKRAAVQWGIGRCLYNLKEDFAIICEKGTLGAARGKTKDKELFYWRPPELPEWAVRKKGHGPRVVGEQDDGPVQEKKKTYKNFEFLDKMKEIKAEIGEDDYYALLGKHGYEKSNEIPPANQKAALGAFNKKLQQVVEKREARV